MRAVFRFVVWGFSIAFLAAGLLPSIAAAQQLRIATYNIAADTIGIANPGTTTPPPGTSQIIEGIGEEKYNGIERPVDILALEETTSNDITVAPIVSDLNAFYSGTAVYAQSTVQGLESRNNPTFGNGPNAIVYNTSTVQLIQSLGIGRPQGATNGEDRQVMRYEFEPVGGDASSAFYVYVVHMKSGGGYSNEVRRNGEADIIRNNSATLVTAANPNPRILYMGDFNLDGTALIQDTQSTKAISAYQTMTAPGYGQGLDPLNPTLDYNTTWGFNPAYASILTESVGDLRFRDDMQLMTTNVLNNSTTGTLAYIPGSMHAFGNNGTTAIFGAVDDAGNTALNDIDPAGPITAAQLLSYLANGSDHYPVVADYTFGGGDAVIVPEPSSLILLALGGVLLASRRSRPGNLM